MDYKNKPEVLEWARKHWMEASDVEKKHWEFVFPELAESDDERIRKGLIQHLQELSKCNYEGGSIPVKFPEHYKVWIEWLEKKKECIEKKYIHEAFDKGLQAGAMRKQAEWSKEDEKMLWGFTAYIPNEELERLGVTRDDILKKLKSLRPQQNQEWSEEDDYRIRWIISLLTTMREKGIDDRFGDSVPDDIPDMIAWLKSLRPQPKQEWSKEDERMRKAVLDEIEHQIEIMPDADDMDSDDQDRYNELISMSVWMENLPKCMKPHWKPSMEQIKALNKVANEGALLDLFNDLLNLL